MYLTACVIDHLTNTFFSSWAEGATKSLRDIRAIADSSLVRFWNCPYFGIARFCQMTMKRVLEQRTLLM
jgi:hypothetical protein